MANLIARPVRSRTDDIFFTIMSVVMLATVLFGFARTYFLAGMIRAPLPSILVHIHGAVFSSWILLFLIQTTLISVGNVRLHRKLGWVGAFLAAAMLVLGVLATCAAVRRGVTGAGFTLPLFFVLNNLEVILFAALVAWGIAVRYNRPIHKRLMLLATLALMGPAIGRWPLQFMHERPYLISVFFFIEGFSVLVFDLVTRRKPYWQTVVATLLIPALLPLGIGLSQAPPMQHLINWVLHG
jgi:hypothetical protein